MNIALLQGSPNITGSTALLCEQFTQGARASGHEVDRIDLAELSLYWLCALWIRRPSLRATRRHENSTRNNT